MNQQSIIPSIFNNYANAFFVGSLVNNKTFYVNKKAEEIFGMTVDNADFTKIFQRDETLFVDVMMETLKTETTCMLYNYMATGVNGNKFLVDLHLGFYNEEKTEVFLEIIPQNEDKKKLLTQLITYSSRPAGILHFDEKLSFLQINEHFYQFLDCQHHNDLSQFDFTLGNTFCLENKTTSQDIINEMKEFKPYYFEVLISTVSGAKKWISLSLEKKEYGEDDVKILCYARNIEEKVRDLAELRKLNRYFSGLESITGESFYRVDLQKKELYQRGVVAKELGLDQITEGYPENVYHLMHPDDLPLYKAFAIKILDGHPTNLEMRVKNLQGEYHWYYKEAVAIYDDNGTVVEIIGKMNNIHREKVMEKEVSTVNRYFTAMQQLTEDILFHIDIKTMIFTHNDKNAQDFGVPVEIPNFVETFIAQEFVRPEDAEAYREYTSKLLSGQQMEYEIQAAIAEGVYQWFRIKSTFIYNEKDEPVEIFGTMENIHKEKNMELKMSTLNQYVEAVQSLSGESLYYVDVNTRVLRQKGEVAIELGVPDEIPNYPEGAYPFIFPDDLPLFQEFSSNATSGIPSTVEVRVLRASGEYNWYEITSKIILDSAGNMMEIFGRMTNIQEKYDLKVEVAETSKYMEMMQGLTDDILYHIDVKNMVLYYTSKGKDGIIQSYVYENYPASVFENNLIHPEDIPLIHEQTEEWTAGNMKDYKLRFRLVTDDFQWYVDSGVCVRDEQGEITEIVGRLKNVHTEETMAEENSTLTKYFDVMQTFSKDILYRVEVATMTLYHSYESELARKLGNVIPDYLNYFLEHEIIHPDDTEAYVEGLKAWMKDDSLVIEARFAINTEKYEWYTVKGTQIFDEDGNFVEFVGTLVNIDKEKNMESEVSAMSRYFEVIQEFCSDILYRVDVPVKTLYLAGESQQALRVGSVIPNYLETFVGEKIVHPDDAQKYLEKYHAWLLDDSVECEVRFNLIQEEYEWYSVKRRKIFDDDGNLVEILGALVSVQKERELTQKFEEENRYFEIMQQLSQDIYYRVEVETMTLHHAFDSKKAITSQKIIPDYVNTFIRENIVHPDDVEQYLIDLAAFNEDELMDISVRFSLYDDEYHWYKARGRKIYDENGKVIEILGRLISEQEEKKAKLELNAVNQQFNAMQNLSSDVLFHIDIETLTFFHNESNSLKYGLPSTIPNYVEFFIEKGFIGKEEIEKYRENTEKLHRCEISSFETRLLTKGNVYDWYELRCEPLRNEEGMVTQLFGRLRNIQSQRNLEERAYHDLMTGALNKVSFEEEADKILVESDKNTHHALVFIDLDDFKGVNDTKGHSCGDALLTVVGRRLKAMVRGNDLVGRIGGDEFSVLLLDVSSENSALVRTNLILKELQKEFTFEEHVIGIKASVGVSVFPQHGITYSELIKKSDLAVYESKRRGKNLVSMYSKELKEN